MEVLASVDNNLSIYLWYQILKQAKITINLLLTSRTNPRLSVYAQIFRTFYFNATPMVPPGTKIIAHEKPNRHVTWIKNVVLGWYIGPYLEHYRCYKLFVTETISERIADMVEFFPQNLIMPRECCLMIQPR